MLTRSFIAVLLLTFVLSLSPRIFSQQTDRDLYLGLYRQGQYGKAIIVLKRLTKENSSDGDALYYLGLSYLKVDQERDAVKVLAKAVNKKPDDALIRSALAYAYVLRNDEEHASNEAHEALRLDPKVTGAHYVLSVIGLRNRVYNTAYDEAKRTIELEPNFVAAYLVKSQALVSSFAQQAGTIIRPVNSRGEFLEEAVSDLQKYLSLAPKSSSTPYYEHYLDSIKFFADYYALPENQKTTLTGGASQPDGRTVTPLKILSKPKPAYTDRARDADVNGVVRLLVGLSADGTTKHILVLTSLGYGLDESAVAAARQITYQPRTVDGKPVSSVATFEYSFQTH